MTYTLLKHIHVTTVYLTLALFLLRGFWMLIDSPRLGQRWVRIIPHVNDTMLLAAAIGLLVSAWGNPWHQPWIMAKILGLLVYIGLGTLALKRGRTKARRISFFMAALMAFAYLISVAVTKQVIPGVL